MVTHWKAPGVGYYPEEKPDAAGQIELLRKAIPMARAVGTNMLIMEDITVEKQELCHEAKLAVMPRASMVNTTGGDRFLEAGIDGLFGDAPQRMLNSIQSILGANYLPERGESAADLFSVPI